VLESDARNKAVRPAERDGEDESADETKLVNGEADGARGDD